MENLNFDKNYYDEIYSKLIKDDKTENNKKINKNLLSCNELLNLKFKNRFCITNYYDELFDINGNISEDFFELFYKLSKTNVALICSFGINVEAKNNNFSEINQKKIKDNIKKIHQNGTKIFLTLKTKLGRIEKVSHSLFLSSASLNREYYSAKNLCLPASDSKINKLSKLYAKMTKYAKLSGFDGVVIDGSLSNLLGELASKEFNRRIFGKFSEIEDMPKKIFDNINVFAKNYPVLYKITPLTFFHDIFDGNNLLSLKNIKFKSKINEIFKFMIYLVDMGVDGFLFEFGSKENEFLSQYSPFLASNLYLEFYKDLDKFFKDNNIKNKFNNDVFLICSDNYSHNFYLEDRSNIFFEITKEIYADLNYLHNLRNNCSNRDCIRCGHCKAMAEEKNILECAINPELKYDNKKELKTSNERVAVVGAGVSGIVLSNHLVKRGIKVELFDSDEILNSNGRKNEIFGFDEYLAKFNRNIENELLENGSKGLIKINLKKRFEPDFCDNFNSIVVATGFKELFLGVPGAVLKSVVSIFDILSKKFDFQNKKHIVIYAKSELALKLAIYLAKEKKDVHILINDYYFLLKIPQNLLSYYLEVASKLKIKISVLCQVKIINEDSVELYINHKTKNIDFVTLISNIRSGVCYKFLPEARTIDCNLFIYDPDVVSNNRLFYDIVKSGYKGEIYMIGDALEVSNLADEIKSAFFVGNNI